MADVNTIGTIPLGKIQTWSDKKTSSITPVSFPGQDAGETEGIDTLGIIAFTDFEGQWTGTFSTIQGYIAQIKGILDGNQTSSSTLRSPFVNTRTTGSVIRADSMGTNTSTSANKLIATTATFSSLGVQAGDLVKNLVTGEVANVTAVDSEIQLSLDADIFTTNPQGFAVSASMNTKLLSLDTRWELPGLSICNYKLSVMQVK